MIHIKGHSEPSGICMVWDVRCLFNQKYELTKGSEGKFIFKAHHAHMHLYFCDYFIQIFTDIVGTLKLTVVIDHEGFNTLLSRKLTPL